MTPKYKRVKRSEIKDMLPVRVNENYRSYKGRVVYFDGRNSVRVYVDEATGSPPLRRDPQAPAVPGTTELACIGSLWHIDNRAK